MQTLNDRELNTVVGGCGCYPGTHTVPSEKVITLPILPGESLQEYYQRRQAQPLPEGWS